MQLSALRVLPFVIESDHVLIVVSNVILILIQPRFDVPKLCYDYSQIKLERAARTSRLREAVRACG